MIAILLALALIAVPGASALDALPARSTLVALEARLLVRAVPGASLHVATDAPARVALAAPGGAPGESADAPATLDVPPDASWRGLPGVVEVVVRRASTSVAMRIEIDDGASGVAFEWPAEPPDPSRFPRSP